MKKYDNYVSKAYQLFRRISVIDMGHIVPVSQHLQPELPIEKGIYRKRFLDNRPRRTGS